MSVLGHLSNYLRGACSQPLLRPTLLKSCARPMVVVPIRTKYYNNRHVIAKWKRHRAAKVLPIDLPDFEEIRNADKENLEPEEMRSKLKEKGVAPSRSWNEKDPFVATTGGVIDPYKPPEDETTSLVGAPKKIVQFPKDKWKTFKHKSKIRSYEPDFNFELFAENDAVGIYQNAYNTLMAHDRERLFEYVTEMCYPHMTEGLRYHTIHWKLLEHIEKPACVHVRYADILTRDNTFGQITVRFHTKQLLAIYDRHGRLIHGSETDVKEVIEYIVFEKHLVNEYSKWRIHERIRPIQEYTQQISKTYEIVQPMKVSV